MITGHFTNDGLPYVECRLFLPRLGIFGPVDFLIDTGSDTTILHPDDGIDVAFPFDALVNPSEVFGVGGAQNYYVENGFIYFDDSGSILEMDVELFVAKPQPGLTGIDSLLGRDVLNRLGMEYDFLQGRLLLGR